MRIRRIKPYRGPVSIVQALLTAVVRYSYLIGRRESGLRPTRRFAGYPAFSTVCLVYARASVKANHEVNVRARLRNT